MFDLFDYRQVCQFLKRGANLHDEDDNGQVCYFFFLTVPSTCQGCSILYNTCYKLIKKLGCRMVLHSVSHWCNDYNSYIIHVFQDPLKIAISAANADIVTL